MRVVIESRDVLGRIQGLLKSVAIDFSKCIVFKFTQTICVFIMVRNSLSLIQTTTTWSGGIFTPSMIVPKKIPKCDSLVISNGGSLGYLRIRREPRKNIQGYVISIKVCV